jgi:hypothetical protein
VVLEELVVTDLTRMRGQKVCVAGYRPDGTCVRPVFHVAQGDLAEAWYRLPVTDLAFQCHLNRLRLGDGHSPEHVANRLHGALRAAEAVYLRIGHTRPTWSTYPGHCFLQVTGVYSFPDYLGGRTFADLAPPALDAGSVPF